jgi:ABC-type oligopeptide transport system substrate-binding subunit
MYRLFVMTLSTLLAVSCQKETQKVRHTREKILLVANGAEPKALDPQMVTGVTESRIITFWMEGISRR